MKSRKYEYRIMTSIDGDYEVGRRLVIFGLPLFWSIYGWRTPTIEKAYVEIERLIKQDNFISEVVS